MYWDPMPVVAGSTGRKVPIDAGRRLRLGPPATYLCGAWEESDRRNVPGAFYGAMTDTCGTGRLVAPRHVVYDDDTGGEIVYRQPTRPDEVYALLAAARTDPFEGYAADGDAHWSLDLIRRWWAERDRLAAWIARARGRLCVSDHAADRDNAAGLADFAGYLRGGLRADLRDYAFWLDNRRAPGPEERLPEL